MSNIPGYTYGTSAVGRSPVTLEELELLKKSLLFTEEDTKFLRMSLPVLRDQVEAILDVWYGFVGGTPHLLKFFTSTSTGKPDGAYLDAVRKRFGKWILDTATAEYDQAWLDYQHEIGLRHTKLKKNKTDSSDAPAQVNLRYILALNVPITATLKPFLAKQNHSADQIEKMHAAWVKSVLLQTILWSQPYIKEGEF